MRNAYWVTRNSDHGLRITDHALFITRPVSRFTSTDRSDSMSRMSKVALGSVVRHCDPLLRTDAFADWEGAVNGLQAENRGTVSCIAAAVDASLATIRLAIAAGADLLVVHHGLFWGPTHPWTGKRYELLRLLLEHNLAVDSSHLPLDANPRLGNNALLCQALALKHCKAFFFEKGRFIGYRSQTRLRRKELIRRLHQALKAPPK